MMDLLTTMELCAKVGINYRRLQYLQEQFGRAFPVPVRKIGKYCLWSPAQVLEVQEIDKDIPKYRKAGQRGA